ncbi:MAG: hypothetical protein AAFN09_17320 [Pseudomonadota bacterium]
MRDDVFQKVIKEGWMGQQTPYDTGSSSVSFDPAENPYEGTIWGQEVQQDYYPDPNWETSKQASHGAARIDGLGHTPEQATIWNAEKENAEALYSSGSPDFYGMDESEPQGGTVWGNEQDHGIQAPEIEAPDIEPE